MRQVAHLVEKAGQNRWPVLVLGETGTGKDMVARAIHAARGEGALVTIDCSSLVGPLMESELFGHVKGSFTGAASTKIGLLESAGGGTAFFDEIGELPVELQAKLLRVLQEKEFRPVGGLGVRRSDFRIIAATNRDLAAEVEKGTFRRDLFYRLNVVNIRMVPLRERKEDIPLLVTHFLNRYGGTHSPVNEVLDALVAYDWPGNVRELEHCIQQMVALNTGPLLQVSALPSPLRNFRRMQRAGYRALAASVTGSAPAISPPPSSLEFEETEPPLPLAEVERRQIVRALEFTRGDRATAAQMLGIGRTTLYRKIREYGLEERRLGRKSA